MAKSASPARGNSKRAIGPKEKKCVALKIHHRGKTYGNVLSAGGDSTKKRIPATMWPRRPGMQGVKEVSDDVPDTPGVTAGPTRSGPWYAWSFGKKISFN